MSSCQIRELIEFNNEVNAELMRSMGIDYRWTTAYHLLANGLDE